MKVDSFKLHSAPSSVKDFLQLFGVMPRISQPQGTTFISTTLILVEIQMSSQFHPTKTNCEDPFYLQSVPWACLRPLVGKH
jgi:hypothetical protein